MYSNGLSFAQLFQSSGCPHKRRTNSYFGLHFQEWLEGAAENLQRIPCILLKPWFQTVRWVTSESFQHDINPFEKPDGHQRTFEAVMMPILRSSSVRSERDQCFDELEEVSLFSRRHELHILKSFEMLSLIQITMRLCWLLSKQIPSVPWGQHTVAIVKKCTSLQCSVFPCKKNSLTSEVIFHFWYHVVTNHSMPLSITLFWSPFKCSTLGPRTWPHSEIHIYWVWVQDILYIEWPVTVVYLEDKSNGRLWSERLLWLPGT